MFVVTDLFNLLDMTVVSEATFITMAKTELLYTKNMDFFQLPWVPFTHFM